MAKRNIYRPLFQNRRLAAGRVTAWESSDHLLVVENRFLSEQYTRLFWADIQTATLYELHSRSLFLLGAELICIVAAVAPVLTWSRGWPLLAGLLTPLLYLLWRFTRRHWGCQITTRTSMRQFALPGGIAACRSMLDKLKDRVTAAQGAVAELSKTEVETQMQHGAANRSGRIRRQPIAAVHVLAFVLGVFSPFSVVVFVLYCLALIAALFLQQDFRFPLSVRSAAVMSQMYASLRVAIWILVNSHIRQDFAPVIFNDWRFGMPQVLFSLYGLAAIFWRPEIAKPPQGSASVLGLR